jgi:hypothetical protein
MAEREDIMAKVKKENPAVYDLMQKLEVEAIKAGCTGAVVTVTEDMTPEEEEMALFEGFLKEGYPPDIADRKAKEWLAMMDRIF